MKKATAKKVQRKEKDMRREYDFSGGVRGKHHKALQAGFTATVHQSDGSTVVKEIAPRQGTVVLEPEVRAYFPDSESVNKALRCLIPLMPKKRLSKTKKAAING